MAIRDSKKETCKDKTTITSIPQHCTYLKSAATPGELTISYKERSVTLVLFLRRRERGWPIPPAAPRTATLERLAAEVEKARLAATEEKTRVAANIVVV